MHFWDIVVPTAVVVIAVWYLYGKLVVKGGCSCGNGGCPNSGMKDGSDCSGSTCGHPGQLDERKRGNK